MKLKPFFSLVLAMSLVAGLSSCDNPEFAKYDKIERVVFSQERIELITGQNVNPEFKVIEKVTGLELDKLNYTFECSSADATVATYDNQTLSTVGVGQTIITLKLVAPKGYSQKNTFTTSVPVVVSDASSVVPLTSVQIGNGTGNFELEVGQSHQFTWTTTPADAYVSSIAITSEDSNVVSVDTTKTATIKAVSAGATSVNFFFYSVDSTPITASVNVTVTEAGILPDPTKIEIIPAGTSTISVGVAIDLGINVTPSNAQVKDINWSSSNEGVASVSSTGRVTGVSEGNATITLTASGLSATKSITVKAGGTAGMENSFNGYYKDVKGLKGAALVSGLKTILLKNINRSYDWSRYEDADQALDDKTSILCLYSRLNYKKSDHVSGSTGWNREHSYPQSKISGDAAKDNHHIFACDNKLNGYRGNDKFGVVSGSNWLKDGYNRTSQCKSGGAYFEPADAAKGEVARATFYVNVVYGNTVANNFQSLALAFQWNNNFGTTLRETTRNDKVQGNQRNRNPFIDFPEFAEMCFDTSYSGPGAFM